MMRVGYHTMNIIQVYDPPMCCSTGVCGTDIDPDIDPDLVNFAAMLSQLATRGIKIERFNLGNQPMAFAGNPRVKALLEKEGTEALPVIFWDGEVHLKGRYPTKEERPAWIRAALGKEEVAL
ncbi:arsenite efflux transporter metallochaperone ArsD [Akkermansiaceae bacterium]|nr:arsenite efflux transporter metallochaperone ArsD [Akkermansiaceae bacterium]